MIDIHNHTNYSDGEHTPEEIVINAANNGIQTIGISDHHKAFFMEHPHYKDFNSYINEINNLKKKYSEKIKISLGIEININFKYKNDENRIPYEELQGLDYVLLERIEGIAPFEYPGKYHIKFKDISIIAERIRNKIGLAHTDIFKLSEIYSEDKGLEYGMDYVLGTMEKYNIFWELNTQAQYKYFDYIMNNGNGKKVALLFDKLEKYKIEVMAGSDTHYIGFDFNVNRLKLANEIAIEGKL